MSTSFNTHIMATTVYSHPQDRTHSGTQILKI